MNSQILPIYKNRIQILLFLFLLVIWTQGLKLEPYLQLFGFTHFSERIAFAQASIGLQSLYFCLLCGWDYRRVPPHSACSLRQSNFLPDWNHYLPISTSQVAEVMNVNITPCPKLCSLETEHMCQKYIKIRQMVN
jgi:hypothetical protein